MYRQYTQPNRMGIVGAIVLIILILLALYGLIQGAFAIVGWVTSQTAKADPTVIAALITGAGTILGSVLITSYHSRLAQERAAEEANRGKKAEIYNRFVISLMETRNSKEVREGKINEVDLEFVNEFVSQIVIHGGPDVIKAYEALRRSGLGLSMQTHREISENLANLLLEMRTELGLSNKGLTQRELLAPFVVGGEYEIDKRLGSF